MKVRERGLLLAMLAAAGMVIVGVLPAYAEQVRVVVPQNVDEWQRFVSARLQRRSVPVVVAGRKHGIVGDYSMKIGFTLKPDGSVLDVHMVQGSGDERLDNAALKIPAIATPFPPFTGDMAPTPRKIIAPLVFNLKSVPPEPETP